MFCMIDSKCSLTRESVKDHQFEFVGNGLYNEYSRYRCKRCKIYCNIGPDVDDSYQYYFEPVDSIWKDFQEKLTCDEFIIKDIIE